jgi:outer membrane protein assembly factor BamC
MAERAGRGQSKDLSGGVVLQIFSTVRRGRLAPIWVALWIGGTGVLSGCSWLHFGTQDEETYDYRKSKPRQEPLEVPPDLSQLPKDDRFALPTAASAAKSANAANAANATNATNAGAATTTPAAAPNTTTASAAAPVAATRSVATAESEPTISPMATNVGAAMLSGAQPKPAAAATPAAPVVNSAAPLALVGSVAPVQANARIERDGNARWLAVDVSPEQAYNVLKEMWVGMGYKIEKDEPLVGVVETDWAEVHPEIQEDAIRNGLHKAFGAFDSNGERNKFRARIERTANNTSEITITNRGMVEVVTGIYHDSSKWQARPSDPELESEMLHRLALRFAPVQPLRVAVASGTADAAAMVAAVPAPAPATASVAGENASSAASRVHQVASGGVMTLQVEDTLERTWRQVGVALDRGSFTIEDRKRDKSVYAVRYLDPEYELSEREKRSWWNRVFNSDAKVPEQQFLIALSANGATTIVEVQDKDGRPDSSPTAQRILSQLMEQLR